MSSQKCTHQGCGKTFSDPEEECCFHPGPPVFHEGQKGWKCCKPRVLTFDEFLTIPPCATGRHSTEKVTTTAADYGSETSSAAASAGANLPAPVISKDGKETFGTERVRAPISQARINPQPAAPKEQVPEEDEPGVTVPAGAKCKRNGCEITYVSEEESREPGSCVHHPGVAIFHEGSKGWSCCKRRVLEFSEFLKIGGCSEGNHCYVGTHKKDEAGGEEIVTCRTDFYQTYTNINASIFLKKTDKDKSTVTFRPTEIDVDLKTTDNKRYQTTIPLYATITPDESTFKVMGTKVEMSLKKADGTSWPALRNDEATGEIIQIGNAPRI
ncbi:hypothetical protein TWF225_006209 [Orbilia oligospora]|nr:hypothetical protein TWF225_006209 [Orbilia oligospora]KAF3242301.1 hypothetical protein TWF128_010545 [Orbilia oligospora]KAF3246826.1 hypothetical protein TWF217_009848 [Orbilia oligospora]KAF3282577.1 hypothetical protein TWF132_010602 [Orbilia oligospora]